MMLGLHLGGVYSMNLDKFAMNCFYLLISRRLIHCLINPQNAFCPSCPILLELLGSTELIIFIFLLFSEYYVVEIIQYVGLLYCLLLFTNMHIRLLWIFFASSIAHLVLLLNNITLFKHTKGYLSSDLLSEGHLGSAHILTVMDTIATNVCLQVFVWHELSPRLGRDQGV